MEKYVVELTSEERKELSVNGRVKTHHYGRVQNQPVMFSFI